MMSFNYLIISKQNSIHFSPFLSQMTRTLSSLSLRFGDSRLFFTLSSCFIHPGQNQHLAPYFFLFLFLVFSYAFSFHASAKFLILTFLTQSSLLKFDSFLFVGLQIRGCLPLSKTQSEFLLLAHLHFCISSYFVFFLRPLASN